MYDLANINCLCEGMFVTGGLTPKNIGMIQGINSPFMKAYLDKGRLNPVLETVPLFAVMTEDIGLRGARVCAERVSLNVSCIHVHMYVVCWASMVSLTQFTIFFSLLCRNLAQ